jgi:uncharacterized protein YukE
VATDQRAIDFEGMRRAVVGFRDQERDLKAKVQHVQTTFNTLGASWGGAAQAAFMQALNPYYELCGGVIAALGGLADDVESVLNAQNKTHVNTVDAASHFASAVPSGGLKGF